MDRGEVDGLDSPQGLFTGQQTSRRASTDGSVEVVAPTSRSNGQGRAHFACAHLFYPVVPAHLQSSPRSAHALASTRQRLANDTELA